MTKKHFFLGVGIIALFLVGGFAALGMIMVSRYDKLDAGNEEDKRVYELAQAQCESEGLVLYAVRTGTTTKKAQCVEMRGKMLDIKLNI